MPTYSYLCQCGREFERVLPLVDYRKPQYCPCGGLAEKIVSAPQLVIPQDIHYQSPIDGRPITSARARAEDLARSDCVPYDPGIRQDYQRRIKESEAALDRSVEETVERHIEAMPSEKREKLHTELTHMEAAPVRQTAPAQAIKTRIAQ